MSHFHPVALGVWNRRELERWRRLDRSVFMPAYGGILMTLVLTRFMGLNLSIAHLALCAVLGALTLGGAAFSGEHGRQREQRRARAIARLRSTVEEFQFAVTKEVRDAAREPQRELRWATTEAATSLGNRLSGELADARAAHDGVRRSERALANIADDHATLAALRQRANALLAAGSTPAAPATPQLALAAS